MNKHQKISSLRNKIKKLEVLYDESKDIDVRDKLIKARREYMNLTGISISGSLNICSRPTYVTGSNKTQLKSNTVTKLG